MLEDIANNQFAGLCGIEAMVGHGVPFYNYKVSTISQVSESVNKYLEHEILQLVNDFQESSELVSLFLHSDYRGKRRGEMLSRCRFLFIAQFPELFSDTIIAEIRGVTDAHGKSPFWEILGRPFFDMDFLEADYLTTTAGKQFISDLIPRYPIFLDLVPAAARDVIGKTHANAIRAKQMLENENIHYNNYIDIFDGGPLINAKTEEVFTVRKSAVAVLSKVAKHIDEGIQVMISNSHLDFRLTVGNMQLDANGEVILTEQTAKALEINPGDMVRYISF